MVNYKVYEDITKTTKIDYPEDIRIYDRAMQYVRTCKNLFKMVDEGRKCNVVVPESVLDLKEIEEYRRYFCKKAKEDGVNYIYFTVPVKVTNG